MADSSTSGNPATDQSCTPNPIPPPPASRRSSNSLSRTTPDRILADSSSYAPLHQVSLLDSPGAASNYSNETTTTIDIPDELDENSHPDGSSSNHDAMGMNVQNTNQPPTYSGSNLGSIQPPPPIYYPGELPPAYQVAAALPTYEEAELTKAGKLDGSQIPIHAEGIPGMINPENNLVTSDSEDIIGDTTAHGNIRNSRAAGGRNGRRGRQFPPGFTLLSFPSLDNSDWMEGNRGGEAIEASELLGNDFVFFTAFLTAFLFNWIGFLLLMCFCHTIAARYGALSGFGLSLAKWTLIVKNSTDLASADNSWLWWLITAFGMLVCMRAIFQYLHIKRTWARLSTSARERLFFFY